MIPHRHNEIQVPEAVTESNSARPVLCGGGYRQWLSRVVNFCVAGVPREPLKVSEPP
jgi:hypothetical protein